MNYYKLSKVARDLGITKQTLWNWKNKGILKFYKPFPNSRLNYIIEDDYYKLLGIKKEKNDKIIIYCRVSSSKNKKDLERQVERVTNYCYAKGYKIYKIIKEIGSGINDKRPKLEKILKDGDFTKIVVEHKDRLTRFGFHYLKILLENQNKEIEVINLSESDKEDLIQDFVSIITSYCAKIYGQRRSKRKTEILIKKLENGNN